MKRFAAAELSGYGWGEDGGLVYPGKPEVRAELFSHSCCTPPFRSSIPSWLNNCPSMNAEGRGEAEGREYALPSSAFHRLLNALCSICCSQHLEQPCLCRIIVYMDMLVGKGLVAGLVSSVHLMQSHTAISPCLLLMGYVMGMSCHVILGTSPL